MMKLEPINPNTGKINPSIDKTNAVHIPQLIQNSKTASYEWRSISLEQKKVIFTQIIDSIKDNVDQLAQLMHDDMGKPIEICRGEVLAYVNGFEETYELVNQAMTPDMLKGSQTHTEVHWVPHGVAAIITPWNFPFGMPWSLLVPTLLTGNTVLFKPSEISSHTGIAIYQHFNKFLPQNVIQLIIGDREQGEALVSEAIDFVGFVGSQATGVAIRKNSSERMTRLLLELGGKDPMIIDNDVDIDRVASYAVTGAIRNTGQVCVSVERIYVHEDIHDQFVEKVVQLTKKIKVNVGVDHPISQITDPILEIGPLSHEKQLIHILKQLEDAKNHGAKILYGGHRIGTNGYYMEPTVVIDVHEKMDLMEDETFGPVIAIQKVKNLDEAIQISNQSRYGLAGTIWTTDEIKGKQLALQMECGLVGLNRSFGGTPNTPWTGSKESGFGYSGGVAGTRTFLQPRSITLNN